MDLLDLLIAERIVLLYSPSGAGKTSLIQAGLLPELEDEGFQVLPVMRVSLEPPPEQAQDLPSNCNRYVLSALLSLEEGVAEDRQLPLTELAGMTLAEYLERRSPAVQTSGSQREDAEATSETQPASARLSFEPDGLASGTSRVVLIFDQFEEILTLDPTDRSLKTEFFTQLGEALRDENVYALLAMREEFPAALDPYLRHLPTRLRTTFRLDLLGVEAAAQAMQEPAAQAGVPLTGAAVTKLIDDLRSVRVQQPDGSMRERPGLYVEPVQLQVVCYRLWSHLPQGVTAIEETHIQEAGDVNAALAGYYADRVRAAATHTTVKERAIREWFGAHLITEQDIRGQVLRGAKQSQGLANTVIAPLVDAHLVRAENRRGATWYELAHDRLIKPVKKNNARWFHANLSPLQRQAALWETQNRSKGLLFRDDALTKAEHWAADHQEDVLPVEEEFLSACREVRAQAQRERRKNRLIRISLLVAILMVVMATGAAVLAWRYYQNAVHQTQIAQIRPLVAYSLQDNAQNRRTRAALLARQAFLLNQRLDGGVDEQIKNALRTILRISNIYEGSGHDAATGTALADVVCRRVALKQALTQDEWREFVGTELDSGPACPQSRDTQQIRLRRENMATDDVEALSLNLQGGRPIEYITNHYEDRGDVIVDHATGLMWQQSGLEEPVSYAVALYYVARLNEEKFAGHDDWRMPTVEELVSLIEPEPYGRKFNYEKSAGRPNWWMTTEEDVAFFIKWDYTSDDLFLDPLFDATQFWIWSADIRRTKDEGSSSSAWLVTFRSGNVYLNGPDGKYYVRAVRS